MGETRYGRSRTIVRSRASARFEKCRSARPIRSQLDRSGFDPDADAAVAGVFAPEQTFPICARRLHKPSVLLIKRLLQPVDQFDPGGGGFDAFLLFRTHPRAGKMSRKQASPGPGLAQS